MNWHTLYQCFKSQLHDLYSDREVRIIAKEWVYFKCEIEFADALIATDLPVNNEILNADLDQLSAGAPYQYVLAKARFRDLILNVNEVVLIPRPETEELLEWVKELRPDGYKKALDIGTGSGCIALSLMFEQVSEEVIGLDVSETAIETARKNETQCLEGKKVDWVCSPIESYTGSGFDLVVSNPPYVLEKDKTSMEAKVLDYEPHLALFVNDDDPLKFYKIIAKKGNDLLVPGGLLMFEIHEKYGLAVKQLLVDEGYSKVEIRKDLNGRDRMVKAIR